MIDSLEWRGGGIRLLFGWSYEGSRWSTHLDTKLGQTARRIANVTFQLEKFVFSRTVIAGVVVKAPLEERNVYQRRVVIHELKHKDFERVRVFIFCLRSRVLYCCQVNCQAMINLGRRISKVILRATVPLASSALRIKQIGLDFRDGSSLCFLGLFKCRIFPSPCSSSIPS